jgi:hypothetical protein
VKVVLYNVGRNLNRAFSTCFSFGVEEMVLVNSNDRSIKWGLKGNLYTAKDRVRVVRATEIPPIGNALAMENYYGPELDEVVWDGVDSILIGGESSGLPRGIEPRQKARIPTVGGYCLTVEAALAITLYAWRTCGC